MDTNINRSRLKNGMKDYIETNKSAFTGGLLFQDAQLEIRQITTSSLTPIRQSIFIGVGVEVVNAFEGASNRNTRNITPNYKVFISVIDFAYLSLIEEENYELFDENLTLVSDRIMNYIKLQKKFSFTGTTYCLIDESWSIKTDDKINFVIDIQNDDFPNLRGHHLISFEMCNCG